MICKLPLSNTKWLDHLNNRKYDACSIGLIPENSKSFFQSGLTFVSENVRCSNLGHYLPDQSLASIDNTINSSTGWVKRTDVFKEVASYIYKTYGIAKDLTLILEAGYSDVGDKFLADKDYIIYNGRPFFVQKIDNSSSELIEKYLRISRSRRLLGVVINDKGIHDLGTSVPLAFFCDSFDLDSIMILERRDHPLGI